jgi:hypothetical protein
MKNINWIVVLSSLVALGLASIAPNAFPAAQAGYGSLHDFGIYLILPAAALLVVLFLISRVRGDRRSSDAILYGALAGFVATLALEAVRYPGFRLGFMPGNLPELMGVLLLDRFAQGPSTGSTLAGYAYHFWNGASFGVIFAVLFGTRRPVWWGALYGILVGVGFMVSPVVEGLGIGWFGIDFGWPFAATVIAAHIAWGVAFGYLIRATASKRVPAPLGGQRGSCSIASSET